LETALNDANKSISKMEANLKDKEEEMIAVKSVLDARDVMVNPTNRKVIIPGLG
jgi:hypothetical protein